MSNVRLDLQKDKDASFLEITDASEKQVDKVIDGFFSFFGVNPTPPQPEKTIQTPIQKPVLQPVAVEPEPVAVKPVNIVQPITTPAQYAPPLQTAYAQPRVGVIKNVHNNVEVEGEPTSMAEVYKSKLPANAPAHAFTGIKKGENGKPDRYQTRYRCPKCKKSGKHFIPEGVETVDCHHCQCSMPVKKATPGTQGIAPDRFNNWFVAGEQLPVERFEYGKAHTIK